MNGKRARAERRRLDPRTYQVVMLGAMEWDALPPGRCSECREDTPHRRCRYSGYNSGYRANLRARAGEADDAHTDRVYREMNARQREGDFSLMVLPRTLCWGCALRAVQFVAMAGFEEGSAMVQHLLALVAVMAVTGQRPFTAFMVTAEPGADGQWRASFPTAAGPFDPDRMYQAVRREVDAGRADVYGPSGFRTLWNWREPKASA